MKIIPLGLLWAAMVASVGSVQAASSPEAAVAKEVREARKLCTDETIETTVERVQLAPSMPAAVVSLTSDAGICFGQVGENNYLVVNRNGQWQKVLSAEPGIIEVIPSKGRQVADVRLQTVGMCSITYSWNGKAYMAKTSRGCRGLMRPPSLHDLAGWIENK